MTMISKDGEITKFPGYHSSKEEVEENEGLKEVWEKIEKCRHMRSTFVLGSLNIYVGQHNYSSAPSQVDLQQLQNTIPQIVTQVTANVNNGNGGNGNGGNDGCSYKTFTTCNPKEFDGKGVQ
ncbi:hypothetical protein Tco_0058041 [Tanacetum coccineum]